MPVQRWVVSVVVAGMLLMGAGSSGRGLAWGQAGPPSSQSPGGGVRGLFAGGTASVLVPQTQVVYETVQSSECVQVPVTHMQTLYRTEYRTQTVPVTRMVPETVNETRTYTVCVPKQQVVRQPVTRIVCEPVTMKRRCYRPVPVTKNVERTIYQTAMLHRDRDQGSDAHGPPVRQRDRAGDAVPPGRGEPDLLRHPADPHHDDGPGRYLRPRLRPPLRRRLRPVRGGHGLRPAIAPSPRASSSRSPSRGRWSARSPRPIQVPRQRTTFVPVKETVQVPQVKVDRIPIKFVECVNTVEMQPYEITVTDIVPKRVTDYVEATVCTMVPEQRSVVVPVVRCRPVTETVTRQVAVCVPYQVPVTVMTTQVRPVAAAGGRHADGHGSHHRSGRFRPGRDAAESSLTFCSESGEGGERGASAPCPFDPTGGCRPPLVSSSPTRIDH